MDVYLSAIIQGLCLAAMAAGIFLSIKIFNIPDITTDGSYTLGGVVTAVMLSGHYSLWLTGILALIAGAIAGAATGLIHTKLKVNALLAGILVMTALYSVNLTILGRSNIPLLNLPTVFNWLPITADESVNTFASAVLLIAILVIIIGYVLRTDFGVAMRATGDSETMIRAMGVNTDRMKITGLAIANALTAFSGFMMVQLQGFADINMGIGIVIIGLGSVIIAETAINYFKLTAIAMSLMLVVCGSVMFQLVLAFTLAIGIDANLLKLVTACVVLVIVGLPRLKLGRADD